MELGWRYHITLWASPALGAVEWAAMAVTAVRPGFDTPGDVNGDVTLTWPSQRPMPLQDSNLKTGDSVVELETAIGYAVSSHLNVFLYSRISFLAFSDQPARVEHMIVWLLPGAKVGRAKLLQNVAACRKTRRFCRDSRIVVTTIDVDVARERSEEAEST